MARRLGLSRDDVITTACDIANAEGLDAVTLAAVARRLGIRSPSLYAHVEGLDGLRREIALAGASAMAESFRSAGEGRPPLEALRAIVLTYRDFARIHPGLYESTQRAVAPGGDDELYRALAEVVRPVFRNLEDLGASPTDQVHLTRAIRSALHGFVVLEQSGGFGMPESIDESFDRMTDLLISAVQAVSKASRAHPPGPTSTTHEE
jgi:AcrR family transcriptional regulator